MLKVLVTALVVALVNADCIAPYDPEANVWPYARRWPSTTIPYAINHQEIPLEDVRHARIHQAMHHIGNLTDYRFRESVEGDPGFILFRTGTGCSSSVGFQGGAQRVSLSPSCPVGSVIHEILHALGLYHEHTRPDRDAFVIVDPSVSGSVNYHRVDAAWSVGDYDYNSIMHYAESDVLTSRNQSAPTPGQRLGLSPGDIAALRFLAAGGLNEPGTEEPTPEPEEPSTPSGQVKICTRNDECNFPNGDCMTVSGQDVGVCFCREGWSGIACDILVPDGTGGGGLGQSQALQCFAKLAAASEQHASGAAAVTHAIAECTLIFSNDTTV